MKWVGKIGYVKKEIVRQTVFQKKVGLVGLYFLTFLLIGYNMLEIKNLYDHSICYITWSMSNQREHAGYRKWRES